ncbi:hypothetical protein BGZ58_008739 [Dissophora ornata]|nr:hypothetical protein BGZ58_008739 [Dissophora ornata]
MPGQDGNPSLANQETTVQDSYDEQATVCAIETFAEHWTEAQALSVATLAACQIPEPDQEIDIRAEIINDLLYIGLGFEPSSRSRKKAPIQELNRDLAGLDLDVPPGYSETDDLYPIGATDSKQEYEYHHVLASPIELPPPSLPPRQGQQAGMPPRLPPRAPSSCSSASTSGSSSPSSPSRKKRRGRVQPLEYDARARAVIFAMCKYLLLSFEAFMVIEKQIAQHLYFYQQELVEAEKAELERERQLKEEQQRLQFHQQGAGPSTKMGAFFNSFRGNRNNGNNNNVPLNQHGVAMQTQAQSSMQELEKKKKTWRYVATGLSIAAGATVIGLTGGLAAPLVAVGAGVLLGSGAAVLGTTAGIAVMASLFGLAGGGLAGYKMHRRTKDLKVLSFIPIVKDPTLPQIPSLHLAIVISGYLFDESEVTDAWQGTVDHALDGIDVFHLTFEPAELVTLGNAFKVFVATEAVRMVSTQVIQQTVFAALASALVLPFGLMRAGDLIDNPWAVAMDRARKSGLVLADILVERVQGNRPTTLIGYSTGAVVIWECLLELAKRKEHGLVNSVVLLGAPIKNDMTEKWEAASSVVSHRFVNGYSKKDVVLGSIFRLHSLGLNVAGLQAVEAVSRVENMDLTDIVGGHLEYRENLNMIISLLGVL